MHIYFPPPRSERALLGGDGMWRQLLPIQVAVRGTATPILWAHIPAETQGHTFHTVFWPLTSPHLEVSPRLSQSHRTAELKRPQEYLV